MTSQSCELPKHTIEGKTYYVDARLKELRLVADPNARLSFKDYIVAMRIAMISCITTTEDTSELKLKLLKESVSFDRARGVMSTATTFQTIKELEAKLAAKTNTHSVQPLCQPSRAKRR